MNIVDMVVECMKYFEHVVGDDLMLGVTDLKEFKYYKPAKELDLKLKGTPISSDDPNLNNALRNGKISVSRVPASAYGFALDATSVPLKDKQGNIVGAIASAYTLQHNEFMSNVTVEIEKISNQLSDMVQLIAAQSQQLSATTAEIQSNTSKAVENSKEVNQVAGFIREISEQTNLLGLNAAIEAARVGEAGAGFGVVASEVRKLSVDTKNATQNIESSLGGVQQSILQMEKEISAIAVSSNEQAQLVNEFSEVVSNLNSVSRDFKKFMDTFLKSRL
ncbi:hypothetical protein AR543_10745 [Paenibacillus bovis]|uniref:Methyl-accepting transducer domain-containing protein n=2 Tax=Paenibacillus bovis TaxID=1616788 RepID=A0A172ZMH6_9BACL|nr:hypothetical protein AR543_10745 [Paenibacillus bovis]